ncbi:MAG TPA: AI-2E family transporter [Burkholderiales bacterium]|nr:AI-2E family transporter [Burkholderiales bacterium]
MAHAQRTDRMLGLAALALLMAGCLLVLLPFVTALLWAVILTFSTWPLYDRVKRSVGGQRTVAAALMTLAVALVMLAPFVIVVFGLADNAAELIDELRRVFDRGLPDAPSWVRELPVVGERLAAYWQAIVHDETRLLEELRGMLVAMRAFLIAGSGYLAAGVLQLSLSVFVAFFLFRDGEAAAARLQQATLRVAGPDARYLLDVAGHTVHSVVYGILGTALAQGVLAGIGFVIAGVPGASLLGLATFFLSVVPVGPPIVWGSAAAWLYYQGAVGWAIFVVLWGLLVVSMVDNFLKPFIISRGSSLPFVLVFLGVLGGVVAFGFIGVFLGPTLLAVGYRILDEWAGEQVEMQ